jgi:hypothetical protein
MNESASRPTTRDTRTYGTRGSAVVTTLRRRRSADDAVPDHAPDELRPLGWSPRRTADPVLVDLGQAAVGVVDLRLLGAGLSLSFTAALAASGFSSCADCDADACPCKCAGDWAQRARAADKSHLPGRCRGRRATYSRPVLPALPILNFPCPPRTRPDNGRRAVRSGSRGPAVCRPPPYRPSEESPTGFGGMGRTLAYTVGRMFWLTRKTFCGS